jgi:hypothetical protein
VIAPVNLDEAFIERPSAIYQTFARHSPRCGIVAKDRHTVEQVVS